MKIQRIFIPGDKWVYFKIYTGVNIADEILGSTLFRIIKKMIANGFVLKFYFIRYYDPDFHIRLRLLKCDNISASDILDLIYHTLKPMVRKQLVWKIQLDTYQREIERYNPSLIENTESVFYIDSMCIIQIIHFLEKSQDEEYRWMISLSLIDKFLSDFNYDLEQKKDFMTLLGDTFKSEFGFDKFNSKQLNQKYKIDKLKVESVLNNMNFDDNFIKLNKLVSKRSVDMSPFINNMQNIIKTRRLKTQDYIGSYIHMTMNRLFKAENRLYELIIYDYMRRYYAGQVARNNQPVS